MPDRKSTPRARQNKSQSTRRADGKWVKGGPSPNPAGRRRKRRDAWQNTATGLGTSRDKRTYGNLALSIVTDLEARDLWRGNDMAARVIESAPNEAFAKPFEVKLEDKELGEKLMSYLEDLPGPDFVGRGAVAAFRKARQFRRAYGGAAIYPVINDSSGNLMLPLDEKRVSKVERLMVFEPRELMPWTWYQYPHERAGEVETYMLQPISTGHSYAPVTIHESRLIIVQGLRVSREEGILTRSGWGDNVFTQVGSVLNDFELGYSSAASLIQDFSQAIIKMKGWATTNGIGVDTGQRLADMELLRSVMRAIVLDSEDSFERVTTTLTGMSDVLDRLAYRLAAAFRMPVTKLLGMAPGGLNATGASDEQNWDREVAGEQADSVPMVERLVKLCMLAIDGPFKGKEPDVWSVEFPPISRESAKEKSERLNTDATRAETLINAGVVSAEDVAESFYKGDTYSGDIVIDWDAREAQEGLDPNTPIEGSTAPTVGAAGDASVQQTAFNGAQVSSMVEVVKAAIAKEIPRESAAAILQIAFPVTAAQAAQLLGPESFEATPAAPAPAFGKPAPSTPPPGTTGGAGAPADDPEVKA